MSGFESEALFPSPIRHVGSFSEFGNVQAREVELAYELTKERTAQAQGQLALFEVGIGGMYITQELF